MLRPWRVYVKQTIISTLTQDVNYRPMDIILGPHYRTRNQARGAKRALERRYGKGTIGIVKLVESR